ncbi:MAG: 4Fe-4S dicluster domain-containing protein [Candidatus Omnitrophica bacterium]|nr:4Fe-4S dicluster domain-containing protein [Candidatus Omnitrophota bacterium]MCM8827934.1 4Fe-4S dicluster domain-containing protein [Candidatus Omnitrophota bacterium]
MGKRFSVKIAKNRCKGCGLCIDVCSQKNLILSKSFNASGYHFIEVSSNSCKGCKKCSIICPDAAIEIFLEENSIQSQQKKEEK